MIILILLIILLIILVLFNTKTQLRFSLILNAKVNYFTFSYTLPSTTTVNGVKGKFYKWPVLYLIDVTDILDPVSKSNLTASFFNRLITYSFIPPKVLLNKDYITYRSGVNSSDSLYYSPINYSGVNTIITNSFIISGGSTGNTAISIPYGFDSESTSTSFKSKYFPNLISLSNLYSSDTNFGNTGTLINNDNSINPGSNVTLSLNNSTSFFTTFSDNRKYVLGIADQWMNFGYSHKNPLFAGENILPKRYSTFRYFDINFNIPAPPTTPFIFTIKISTNNTTFTLPILIGVAGTEYNFTIDWGNSLSQTIKNPASAPNRVYSTVGTYTVTITGIFKGFSFNNSASAPLLDTITQWGTSLKFIDQGSIGTNGFFYGCTNLSTIPASDYPDFTSTTSLNSMFHNCTSLTSVSNINNWVLSTITSLSEMFSNCSKFNQSISLSTTSSLTDVSYMFTGCSSLNNTIAFSTMTEIITMSNMFNGCSSFNKAISFNTGTSLTDLSNMFSGCTVFNNNIFSASAANMLTGVTSMSGMFSNCIAYSKTTSFNTSTSLTDLSNMFNGCTVFNTNIIFSANALTKLTGVTSMSGMFSNCISFAKTISFTTSLSLTDLSNMFKGSTNFNNSITITNMKGVTSTSEMFSNCKKLAMSFTFDTGTSLTDTSNMFNGCTLFNGTVFSASALLLLTGVTNMSGMFSNCAAFNQAVNFTTSSLLTDTSNMFNGCTLFNNTITISNMTGVTNMSGMFSKCINFNKAINFTTSASLVNITNMLEGCNTFNGGNSAGVGGTGFVITNTSGITSLASLFSGNTWFNQKVNLITSSSLKDTSNMFNGCTNFNNSITLSDMTGVVTTQKMFYGCIVLNKGINFTTSSSLTNVSDMFNGCIVFNAGYGEVIQFVISDMTGVTTTSRMFMNCPFFGQQIFFTISTKLTDVSDMFNGCINFNSNVFTNPTQLTNVTTMARMFMNCSRFSQTLNFTISTNLTDVSNMLYGCTVFNNTVFTNPTELTNVVTMAGMFQEARSFTMDLNFTISTKLTDVSNMFNGAVSFNGSIFTNPDQLTSVTSMAGMFSSGAAIGSSLRRDLNFKISTSLKDTSFMFTGASSFDNQVIFTNPDQLTGVTAMEAMFKNMYGINRALNFTISTNLTNIKDMFSGTNKFNNIIFTNPTQLTGVTTMSGMFEGAYTFDQRINFTTSSALKDLSNMFKNAYKFNNGGNNSLIISVTSGVTSMSGMFAFTTNFNQPVVFTNTDSLTDLSGMFEAANVFNNTLTIPNAVNVTTVERMFVVTGSFNQTLSLRTSALLKTTKNMFYGSKFNNGASSTGTMLTDTSGVTDMSWMFGYNTVFNKPVSFNCTSVTTMRCMFYSCTAFNNSFVYTSVANVNDFSGMFYKCGGSSAYTALNSAAKNASGASSWVNAKSA